MPSSKRPKTAIERLTGRVMAERARAEALVGTRRDPHREYDHRGRKRPTRIDLALLLRAIPGLAERFDRKVPVAHITRTPASEAVTVNCPCGTDHVIAPDVIEVAPCGRAFMWDTEHVYVAGAPDQG